MAVLQFKVQADYDKVVRLREEIAKLEAQMRDSPNKNYIPIMTDYMQLCKVIVCVCDMPYRLLN